MLWNDRRTWCLGLLLAVLLSSRAGVAVAQDNFGQARRPTTSPYLNLLRRGNIGGRAALDYYGIVRPEQQLRQTTSRLNRQVSDLNREVQDLGSTTGQRRSLERGGISPTGHRTTFFDQGSYFPGAR